MRTAANNLIYLTALTQSMDDRFIEVLSECCPRGVYNITVNISYNFLVKGHLKLSKVRMTWNRRTVFSVLAMATTFGIVRLAILTILSTPSMLLYVSASQ
jgi:hypothetical protein